MEGGVVHRIEIAIVGTPGPETLIPLGPSAAATARVAALEAENARLKLGVRGMRSRCVGRKTASAPALLRLIDALLQEGG